MGSTDTTEGTGLSSNPRQLSHSPLLGSDVDSGDEDPGTIAIQVALATRPLNDADVIEKDERNDYDTGRRRTPNNPNSEPKSESSMSHILDWFLGRHAHMALEGSEDERGPREHDHVQDALDDYLDIRDVRDVCPECATPYYQAADSKPFINSLKLVYNGTMPRKWLIGNRYILHEAVDDHPEDEYVPLVEASRALKELAPNIPTLKVRAGWKENGKVLILADAVPGERLYDIWWDISDAERETIAKQVALHIESWRESDLGRISSFTGSPIYGHDNLFGATEGGFGPFRSDLELWLAIEQRLRKKGIDEDTIQLLRYHMPPSSPYVFTHGDLSSRNIVVDQGEVIAITGFENAASLPSWAENVAMHFCSCAEDEQWKGHLSKYMRSYREALDWWSLWTAVEDTGIDQAQLESLKARCQRWEKTEIPGLPFRSRWLRQGQGASGCLNTRPAGDEAEMHVGELNRQVIVPGPLHERNGQDLLSDNSWLCSSDGEECGGADDGDGQRPKESGSARKGGLVAHYQIRRRRPDPLSPTPGWVIEASGSEHRKLTPRLLPGEKTNSTPITAIHSDPDSELGGGPTKPFRTRNRDKLEVLEDAGPDPGCRRLSIPPVFTLSESTRSELCCAGDGEAEGSDGTSREDINIGRSVRKAGSNGASRSPKRVSKFIKAAPSVAPAEVKLRRHERSRSVERTHAENPKAGGCRASRSRPRSLLQPPATTFRHAGFEGRGRVRDSDEKYGFR